MFIRSDNVGNAISGVSFVLGQAELLDRMEHDPRRLSPGQEGLQPRPGLRLDRGLRRWGAIWWRRRCPPNNWLAVVAVGEHQEGRVIHGRVAHERARRPGYLERFSRALCVPTIPARRSPPPSMVWWAAFRDGPVPVLFRPDLGHLCAVAGVGEEVAASVLHGTLCRGCQPGDDLDLWAVLWSRGYCLSMVFHAWPWSACADQCVPIRPGNPSEITTPAFQVITGREPGPCGA